MKTKTSAIALFLALSLLFGAAHAASVLDNALSLANLTVTPNPVVAGGNATIRFQLFNSYGSWINNVNLEPSGAYPLLNISPHGSQSIVQVNPGLNPTYYTFNFTVPKTTPSGVYKIYFNASYTAIGAAQVISVGSMPVSFYVQNKPAIRVVASAPQPSALYAGYNQTVRLQVQNVGYGTARNVSVSLLGEQGLNILSSVTTFFVSNLTQGSTANESVLVSARNVGAAGMLATVDYYSSTFKQHFHGVQNLNLSIAPAAQFSIVSGSYDGAGVGATDIPVTFAVRNSGTSDASEVQLSLQTSYPVTPVQSTAYIATLPAGATANATFLVSIDSQAVPGNYPVTLYEQWKQPNGAVNQQFSGSNNYFVGVGSQQGGTPLLVIAVVIILAAVVVYRMRMQGKQSKKK